MWLDKQISMYECPADNTGRPTTLRQALLCQFALSHPYYYKTYPDDKWLYPKGKWENGTCNDLDSIINLRTRDVTDSNKTLIKQTMQCFTPAALLKTKKKNQVEELSRTGLLQLDFDYKDISDYDIDELKLCVFNLEFIALCSLSVSGKGFYALAMIAEPDKLSAYAEHCFEVLMKFGIQVDTTKGRNVHDLRFVSYDSNMLIRENPKPLEIKRFRQKASKSNHVVTSYKTKPNESTGLVKASLLRIREAQPGTRITTIQQVAYTLGGLGRPELLDEIKYTIFQSNQYAAGIDRSINCAEDCFRNGMANPLIVKQ